MSASDLAALILARHGFTLEDYQSIYATAFAGDDPHRPVKGHDGAIVANDLASLLVDQAVTVASLGDQGRLLGFTFAVPIGRVELQRFAESEETAYIHYTAIASERQGQGLVAALMRDLLNKLASAGYRFIERDCMVDTGYADKVQRAHASAIVQSYDHHRYAGERPQRFFRIDLRRTLENDLHQTPPRGR